MNPEERTWEVVRLAFEERTHVPRRRGHAKTAVAIAIVVLAAIVGATLSPPGHAVFERVRKAVGVEHAAPALFSLPGGGRLLVVSGGEAWLVEPDGARRSLGAYTDAEWSPHGLYVVATRANEIAALSPEGQVRWTLARRAPRAPRWEGTRTDTRIAYDTAGGLRVVAGDGTGDHLLDAHGGSVPAAWDPARLHTLAYVSLGVVELRRDDGKLVWRRRLSVTPTGLAWSSDGRYLAVFSAGRVVVLAGATGTPRRTIAMLGARLASGSFAPGSHRLAVRVELHGRSQVHVVDLDRPGHGQLVLAGPGSFGGLAWSPDGSWLLVSWPAANQWVFLHGTRAHAVGNIRAQFPGAAQIAGRWCCPSG
ncbi:MAG TPA: hypothetical protein VHV52_08960 [Gaiellaceae bacterium]|nr:hypothetical protein [Gaiellaceae bacterium]